MRGMGRLLLITECYNGDITNSMDGNISFDNTVSKFGYALMLKMHGNTNAFPASMGVADNNPRAISFWMYAEDHGGANNRDTQTGIYGMVLGAARVILIGCGGCGIVGYCKL